jgi:hypothetical protein
MIVDLSPTDDCQIGPTLVAPQNGTQMSITYTAILDAYRSIVLFPSIDYPLWRIRRAVFSVTRVTTSGSNSFCKLYGLTNTFVEAEASWSERSTGVNWTLAGGDYNVSPLAQFQMQDSSPFEWEVTDFAKSVANGAGVVGFLMRLVSESGTPGLLVLHTSEAASASNRPYLRVWVGTGMLPGGVEPRTRSVLHRSRARERSSM